MIHRDGSLPDAIDDLRDGQAIHADGATLVAVHTPGHASDHLCFYLVEEKSLFTGDVVLGGSTTVIPSDDGDLLEYMDSLRRLLALDVRRIYPAHGPVIEDGPGRIREYIDHRLMRERQILEALGSGLRTIPAMVERIYADVPQNLHAAAAMSVESHLKKLKREGRVSETVERDAPSRWELLA
jgi:glyoxylase-like metal-dependent hydrolase (beta-lactamase superfamily II)